MGWFGFNAGSTLAITGESASAVSLIILNTNLAAAMGGMFALIITWLKYKKADIAMTLNGTLAGLVGITAGCAVVEPMSALIIGGVCGIATTIVAEVIEKNLKIDDAVGSFAVHGVSGILGTILVGVFAQKVGLIYGGGFEQLKVQAIGAFSVAAWAVSITAILVFILKYTVGVRVPLSHEISGLDNTEHNIEFDNKQLEAKEEVAAEATVSAQ